MQATTIAASAGFAGSSERMNSGWPWSWGQSIPSALAVRRSRLTASSGAGGSVRRMPDLPLDHDRGGGEAGHQRDLRVPRLDGQHFAELQAPPTVDDVDLLGGHRQRDPASLRLLRDPQLADRLEHRECRPFAVPVDLVLHARVVQLLPRPDQRPLDRRLADLPAASSRIVHTKAGRTWSGSSDAAAS